MAYNSIQRSLQGVVFTVITPFSDDGEQLDNEQLASNITYLEKTGAEIFLSCGNTSEYYALSDKERVESVATTVTAVDDGLVIGGVGGSTKDALNLIAAYEDAGADAALVMHPDHTFLHHRGLLEYYQKLAASTDIGIVIYKRGPEITTEILAELSKIENVVAVKYALGDIVDFSRSVRNVPDDIVWINGSAERFAPSFALEGAEGFTTGIGCFVPEPCLALIDALREEEWEHARQIRDLLWPLEEIRQEPGANNTITAANNVPVLKYGMKLIGRDSGPVREPLVELSDNDKQRVQDYYERIQDSKYS